MMMLTIHRTIPLLFVPVTLYIFTTVCDKQPVPYMDEVFHYPQALRYFQGKFFEWDSKITTPPGLYLMSNGILLPLSKAFTFDATNLTFYRATNVLFMIGNFFLFLRILQKIHHKDISEDAVLLSALNLSVFPLLYFFTFLYYTDCGSVFFVLLMYLLHLNHHQWIAAVFGSMSVLFRQTNIIWMFFIAAHPVFLALSSKNQRQKGPHSSAQKVKSARSSNYMKKLRTKLANQLQYWIPIISDVTYINFGYLVTGACFLFFVYTNKSVVLGDRDAHKLVVNIPQCFYFMLFCLFFSSPLLISLHLFKAFLAMLRKRTFIVILAAAGIALCIRYLTYEHPYLLADNRHYTFYIWKKILHRNMYFTHMIVIAPSIYCGWAIFYQLKHKDLFWKLLYVFCVVLSIVPQELLELRYFIMPFIFFRLHIRLKSLTHIYCEFFLFLVVNLLTIYLFLQRSFLWDGDDRSIQRFMW